MMEQEDFFFVVFGKASGLPVFFCFNVLLSCFLERQNVHSTSHSYGSLPVLCNFPKHMLLLKYLHDSHVLFICLCSEPSITVITSHSQTNISFNFQGKIFFFKVTLHVVRFILCLFQATRSDWLRLIFILVSFLPLHPHGLYGGCSSSICFPVNLASFPPGWSTSTG